MIFKIFQLSALMVLLASCEDSNYKKILEPSYKIKLADTNPNPIFFGEVEPPIPTIEEVMDGGLGIDRNKNGIRDDIDIWINRTGENYNEVMALRQKAKALQEFLVVALEKRNRDVELVMNKSFRASYCMDVVFYSTPKFEKRNKREFEIRELHFFPKARAELSVGFYKNIILYGGGEYGKNEDRYKYCNFLVNKPKELIFNFLKSIGLKEENIKWEEN